MEWATTPSILYIHTQLNTRQIRSVIGGHITSFTSLYLTACCWRPKQPLAQATHVSALCHFTKASIRATRSMHCTSYPAFKYPHGLLKATMQPRSCNRGRPLLEEKKAPQPFGGTHFSSCSPADQKLLVRSRPAYARFLELQQAAAAQKVRALDGIG